MCYKIDQKSCLKERMHVPITGSLALSVKFIIHVQRLYNTHVYSMPNTFTNKDHTIDYESIMKHQENLLLRSDGLEDDELTHAEHRGVFTTLWNKVLLDFTSYIAEYGVPLSSMSPMVLEKRIALTESINIHDIVVIAKAGCGFCQRAKDLLADQQEKVSFSQNVIIGTDYYTKAAISAALNLYDVTYPQIIIRGVYIGGSDELRQLVETDAFQILLAKHPPLLASKDSFIEWYPQLQQQAKNPDFFRVPNMKANGKGRWYLFQWYMYANLVRYISISHIILLVLCLIFSSVNKRLCTLFVYIIVVDLAILVVHGPTPFSPSGVIGAYFGWKYRGNVTSSLPYKVVFAAYLASLIPLLVNKSTDSTAGKASYVSLLINSALLAAFRF